ncbi:MAG TPA: sigma 54-interacting transcriptional regulator [Pirellulales bacterium]|jgi:DNA-binding NtrC family response regulator|nr:sigma 54-interacting transcriptional regulator [Pirellulales bacterium]
MPSRSSRSSLTELTRLFQKAVEPLYVVDEDRRILFANAALGEWAGVQPHELIGQQTNFYSSVENTAVETTAAEEGDSETAPLISNTAAPATAADFPPAISAATPLAGPQSGGPLPTESQRIRILRDVAAALCPPPEALAGARCQMRLLALRPGAAEREADCWPLHSPSGGCAGVLVRLTAVDDAPENAVAPAGDAVALHDRLASFRRAWRGRFQPGRLIGDSPALQQIRAQIELAASGPANVLILGPAGSGRKQIARTIHTLRDPAGHQPLPIVACRDADWEELESQLRGLGAARSTLQTAAAPPAGVPIGCCFLTEVEQLSADSQFSLVKFLAEARPLRIYATAASDLGDRVAQESFRSDLYSALATLVIQIPPLTARRGDIGLLAQAFLEEQNARGGKQLSGFTPDAIEGLVRYPWPGEVGQLQRIVAAAHAAAEGPAIQRGDLPPEILLAEKAHLRRRPPLEPIQLDRTLAELETRLIQRALRQAKQNKSKAAKLLGLSRPRLYRRMVQLGMISPSELVLKPLPDEADENS